MPINWGDKAVLERLIIAMLASNDNRINISNIAHLYGPGMTYDSLENHLRKWKKQATAMKAMSGPEITAKSPVKPKAKKGETGPMKVATVKIGRVVKAKTPTSTTTKTKAKDYIIDLDEDDLKFKVEEGEHVKVGEEAEDKVGEFV